MELRIIGSSSHGNSYLLVSEQDTLILEAGVKFQDIKKALDFDLSRVAGCIYSHAHKDHSKSVLDVCNAGIDCYSSPDAIDSLKAANHHLYPIHPLSRYKIGSFTVLPVEMVHDVRCYGYVIDHPESGRIFFVTDTEMIKKKIPGMNQVLCEANYDMDIVDRNIEAGASIFVRNRVIQSHMSINTTCKFLEANDLSQVNNIVLLHLSDGNSHQEDFIRRVKAVAPGKNVCAADAGMSINLNREPF